ncbi:protein phosphatase regulator [Malassezia cuniculi]|uniref:Protein phosphatase regulator n=1 Tax=Malassezia cuniculi TaxID=948313 RepID=A0AAF0J867_9BASI|nr:protein phosphatase regulator [Malassezia cuniculi]
MPFASGPHIAASTDTAASDDAIIESKPPHICVDYLSHEWKDEDMWNSWKAMTKRKNEIANGVRLENASWRTWAKQRGKLKTVSPDTLNWLKESDVTWLYGPLHGDASPVPPPKVSSMADRLGIDEGRGGKKPILKRRTLSQMLTTPARSPPEFDKPPPTHHEVSTTTAQLSKSLAQVRTQNTLSSALRSPTRPNKDRHISFNNTVEQCIAVDYDEPIYYVDYDEYGTSESGDSIDDGEDRASEVLTIQNNPRAAGGRDEFHTIAKLAPTRLKSIEPEPPQLLAHNAMYDADDLDAQYSLADETPMMHDLRWDESEDYDYLESPAMS